MRVDELRVVTFVFREAFVLRSQFCEQFEKYATVDEQTESRRLGAKTALCNETRVTSRRRGINHAECPRPVSRN